MHDFDQATAGSAQPTASTCTGGDVISCWAECDELRSEFMRRLIDRDPDTSSLEESPPRVIMQYWNDSAGMPPDVQACIDSWKVLDGSGFRWLLFNDSSAQQFIGENFTDRHAQAFEACSHPAMRADYFRLCFMLQVGGLYVDADDRYTGAPIDEAISDSRLLLQPLCYEISTGSMLDPRAAAAEGTNTDRIFYVNNNPLIAPPGHPLVARALEYATEHLLTSSPLGRDIQSLTGPGNLTASLVEHALTLAEKRAALDVALLANWNTIATTTWPLEYRADDRNWRNWVRGERGSA